MSVPYRATCKHGKHRAGGGCLIVADTAVTFADKDCRSVFQPALAAVRDGVTRSLVLQCKFADVWCTLTTVSEIHVAGEAAHPSEWRLIGHDGMAAVPPSAAPRVFPNDEAAEYLGAALKVNTSLTHLYLEG